MCMSLIEECMCMCMSLIEECVHVHVPDCVQSTVCVVYRSETRNGLDTFCISTLLVSGCPNCIRCGAVLVVHQEQRDSKLVSLITCLGSFHTITHCFILTHTRRKNHVPYLSASYAFVAQDAWSQLRMYICLHAHAWTHTGPHIQVRARAARSLPLSATPRRRLGSPVTRCCLSGT